MNAPSHPLVRPIGWLLTTKDGVPGSVRAQLESGLFASLPIFFGGVLNSLIIAAIGAWRHPTPTFEIWLAIEVLLLVARLPVVVWGRRAIKLDRRPPLLLAAVLACAWAASVGFGAFISLTSGDWILATIVGLSAAGMVVGVCLRNFGTPRLAAAMAFLMLMPCAAGAFASNEPIVAIIGVQLPIFLLTIFASAFSLHRLMVSRMTVLGDLQKSESFNRTILESSPDATFILDPNFDVIFCNRSHSAPEGTSMVGKNWVTRLPPEEYDAAMRVLNAAIAGKTANLVTSHTDSIGVHRWYDIVANLINDGSGRILMVARDITHQKLSEEQALWMARHDPLTRLPNRTVLQDQLDVRLTQSCDGSSSALLIVDVDHFKAINDTLGHDAGDALLSVFAARLRSSLGEGDLVARTGGDEFALLVSAQSDKDVIWAAERVHAALAQPFLHDGRQLQCSASIGASVMPRDGATRSEILKAADIALYAAKASGRAQLKIFAPSMKAEVERRDSMIAWARHALRHERIQPYFQPKVSLRTGELVGFEALLRWEDDLGTLRGPDELRAAFDDSTLGTSLTDRMVEQTLFHMRSWLDEGLEFGHVALNVAAGDFRREEFTRNLLGNLAMRQIPAKLLQIEVTETVFLGSGADHVADALRTLCDAGIGIALDDFGTGYASLSHLKQFPVDLLKIDRSFIHDLGRGADAEAITAAVINLGHCMGLEVVAEGIETATQEAQLIALGCDTAQGFLYSRAVSAEEVRAMVSNWQAEPHLHRAGAA